MWDKEHFWNGRIKTSENIFLQKKTMRTLQKIIKTNFFSTWEANQRIVTI